MEHCLRLMGPLQYLHYKSTSEVGGGRKLTWRIWENTGKGGGKFQKGEFFQSPPSFSR